MHDQIVPINSLVICIPRPRRIDLQLTRLFYFKITKYCPFISSTCKFYKIKINRMLLCYIGGSIYSNIGLHIHQLPETVIFTHSITRRSLYQWPLRTLMLFCDNALLIKWSGHLPLNEFNFSCLPIINTPRFMNYFTTNTEYAITVLYQENQPRC